MLTPAFHLPSVATQRGAPSVTHLVRFFDALRGHRKLFAVTFVAMLLIGVLAWLVLPTRYAASASVLIQPKTTDPIAGVVLPGGVISNHLATQSEVMQSEKVLLRAIRATGLQNDPEWREKWKDSTDGRGDYESWLAEQLLKRIDVHNTRESNVLALRFLDPDPERAARVANAIVQAYQETAVDLRLQPARQYSSFFDERVRRAREALDAVQLRLQEFQQRHGIHGLDDRDSLEERRLVEIASQITLLEGKMAETRGRQGETATAAGRSQEAARDPTVIEARIELARQEARMSEIEARMGDEHPLVQEQRQALKQRRALLAAAVSRATQGLASSGNAEAAQLKVLRAAYEEQSAKAIERKALRDEARRMQRDVDNLQRNYEIVLARYQQTSLESEDTQPNVSVLKVATVPPKPATPSLALFLAAAALLGLVAAALAVFFTDRHDGRLRYAEHIMKELQQPFLVQLPTRRPSHGAPGTPTLPEARPTRIHHEHG